MPRELEKFGAKVTIAAAYKTEPARDSTQVELELSAGEIDLITFTSSSTVKNFVNAVREKYLSRAKIAAIGPITAETLKKFGVDADVVAKEFTIAGLVEAIKNFYEGE